MAASEEKTFRGFFTLLLFKDFCATDFQDFWGKQRTAEINNVQNYFFS
jgi:hypothetical protein